MAKQQVRDNGRNDPYANIYSEDHRKWGDELGYCDKDWLEGVWVEWAGVEGRWYPTAIVEEHRADTVVRRDWQLQRYRDFAEALGEHYGYRVWAMEVAWTADETQKVGERIQRCRVTCLTNGKTRDWSREQWIDWLRRLRLATRERAMRDRRDGPVQYCLLDFD